MSSGYRVEKSLFSVLVTLGLVMILGGATAWTIVHGNPYVQKNLDRSPASWTQTEVTQSSTAHRWPERTQAEDLGCWSQATKQPVIVQNKWLRVQGRVCDTDPSSLSVVNTTNGFVATVFQLENQKLSTDYVELMEGTNRLEFRSSDLNGAVQTTEVSVILNR